MKTYDELLFGMKERYRELTGISPDDASDTGIRMAVLAGEVFSLFAQTNWLENQMLPDTASGSFLDLHARNRGLVRKQAVKSKGRIIFYRPDPPEYFDGTQTEEQEYSDIVIPRGTVCAVSGSDPVRFITTDPAILASSQTQVSVEAEALTAGSSSNVLAGAICVQATPIEGIDHISNERFTGGSDEESDEQLRTRIIGTYENVSNGTNKAFYLNAAMSVDTVTAVGVVPRRRGAGTVDVFIMSEDGSPSAELIAQVQSTLDELREINVDVAVDVLTAVRVDVNMSITCKRGYSVSSVIESCEDSIREYFKSLNAGQTMYLSELGKAVSMTEGVLNYTFDRLMRNIEVDDDSLCVVDDINIEGASE